MLTPTTNPPSEAELVAHVRSWLNLVADGQLERASGQLDEANDYGIRWTPNVISQTIAGAYPPDSRFRLEHPEGPIVSRVDCVPGDGRPSVVELGDGSGYSVEHDVPLNGSYSDLTLQMEFRWRGRQLAMVLHDVHVL
jgi:hypothetical protein